MRGGFQTLKHFRRLAVWTPIVAMAASPSAAQQPIPHSIEVTPAALADRTYELPTAWIKDFAKIYLRTPERPAFEIIALRTKEKLSLKSGEVTPPKLRSLIVTGQLGSDSGFQQYFDKRNAEAKRERLFAKANETGFIFTDRIGEFILVPPATWRWMEQPLFVFCQESMMGRLCSSEFYLAEKISVHYDFFSAEVPEREWANLDRQVIDFLSALEARK